MKRKKYFDTGRLFSYRYLPSAKKFLLKQATKNISDLKNDNVKMKKKSRVSLEKIS